MNKLVYMYICLLLARKTYSIGKIFAECFYILN